MSRENAGVAVPSAGRAAPVAVGAALGLFALRRVVLLVAALLPRRGTGPPPVRAPSVAVIVPARDEGVGTEAMLRAMESLEYPADSLSFVLVDDASRDATGERLADWTAGRPRARAISLSVHLGKSGALNAGIAAAEPSDLIAVCDADLRPRPDWLLRLAPCFAEDGVGAATGFLAPINADASRVARYAAVETWTHQLVTSAGKDRLDLNPPALGASAYRRAALEEIGGFRPGAPGEDVHATYALTRAGWRTRFVAEAVVDNAVVADMRGYWRQHIRWARNVFAVRSSAETPAAVCAGDVPLARRVEQWAASAGYADRLAFMAALGLVAAGRLPRSVPAAYLGVVGGEVAVAVVKAGCGARLHAFVAAVATFFAVDVAASMAATAAHLAQRPRTWDATRRRSPAAPPD